MPGMLLRVRTAEQKLTDYLPNFLCLYVFFCFKFPLIFCMVPWAGQISQLPSQRYSFCTALPYRIVVLNSLNSPLIVRRRIKTNATSRFVPTITQL